ncbi:PBP1A family penicillin-binding protein [Marivivens donghaensis]|uniref:peptidoglycan glycosyltransferase n=1 Tax=Marivivens donghaensis TaxID=1699413 RepID=A0ABX0VYF0_9RHOB|nr:PBP1A family penicillin-binding protein [Marivivens donghaensis]NIY71668.1 PBP1A family penicillin-binding protein [Marivivens donghaensis]
MSKSGKNRPPLVADNRYSRRAEQTAKKPEPKKKSPKKRRSPAPRKRRGPIGMILALFGGILRLIWGTIWRGGAIVALIIAGAVWYKSTTLPDMAELIDGRARGSVTMLDRNGREFAWRGDQFAGMITAESVSPNLRNAVVATEDKRFYSHFGVSPRGVLGAIRSNLRSGNGPLSGSGGSTITQQTAKLLCQGQPFDRTIWESEAAYEADCRQTTLWRKITEAVYAMSMELEYTKDEILTIYLNRAYLGAGTRGFEAASQRYFGVSSSEVNPAQAALLAGLLKAPSSYAPTSNLQRSWDRASVVVGLMEDQGYITAAQAQDALNNPAQIVSNARGREGGYFADWVMDSGPSYFTDDTTEDVIISTTFDPKIQQAAEDALAWVFENKVKEGSNAQAAIVVMSADGAVRAMVGGRELTSGGSFNRATQALRQTGSLFKPFVFAAALELGHRPMEIINDAPMCMNIAGSGEWCPQNYDRQFKGPITLTQALQESRNIPTILLSESVGREAVRSVANGFGLSAELAQGPALALGVSESTPLEMTGAYAGILNGGSSVTPYGMNELRLRRDDTPLMGSGGGIGERVIREENARKLTWMMTQVVEHGTGQRARIDGWQIAGKSGTTQALRDAWFIGFTADYVTGVWMGYDDNTPMSGVTGGSLPAEIWHETMVRVLEDMVPLPLPTIAPSSEPAGPVMSDAEAENLINLILRELQR